MACPTEIEAGAGVRISPSQLSKALRKKVPLAASATHADGTQNAAEVERVGLRLQLRKRQAEAGDIVLLYGDESEALGAASANARLRRSRHKWRSQWLPCHLSSGNEAARGCPRPRAALFSAWPCPYGPSARGGNTPNRGEFSGHASVVWTTDRSGS